MSRRVRYMEAFPSKSAGRLSPHGPELPLAVEIGRMHGLILCTPNDPVRAFFRKFFTGGVLFMSPLTGAQNLWSLWAPYRVKSAADRFENGSVGLGTAFLKHLPRRTRRVQRCVAGNSRPQAAKRPEAFNNAALRAAWPCLSRG